MRRREMAESKRPLVLVVCPDCGMGMAPVWTFAKKADEPYVSNEYHWEGIFSWACACNQVCPREQKKAIRDAQHMMEINFE